MYFLQEINSPNSEFKNSNNLFHMQDKIRTNTFLPDIFFILIKSTNANELRWRH